METLQKATVTNNAVTYEGKSFNKNDIYSIDYKEPKGAVMAIITNAMKYGILIIVLVGIPFAIAAVLRDMKKHSVILTLKEHDNKGKRKIVTWYTSKEEWDLIRQNY